MVCISIYMLNNNQNKWFNCISILATEFFTVSEPWWYITELMPDKNQILHRKSSLYK